MTTSTKVISFLMVVSCLAPSLGWATTEMAKVCPREPLTDSRRITVILDEFHAEGFDEEIHPKLSAIKQLMNSALTLGLLSCRNVVPEVIEKSILMEKLKERLAAGENLETSSLFEANLLQRGHPYFLLKGIVQRNDGLLGYSATLSELKNDGLLKSGEGQVIRAGPFSEDASLKGVDALAANVIRGLLGRIQLRPKSLRLAVQCFSFHNDPGLTPLPDSQKDFVQRSIMNSISKVLQRELPTIQIATPLPLSCEGVNISRENLLGKLNSEGLIFGSVYTSSKNGLLAFRVVPQVYLPELPAQMRVIDLAAVAASTNSLLSILAMVTDLERIIGTFFRGAVDYTGSIKYAVLERAYVLMPVNSQSLQDITVHAQELYSSGELELAASILERALSVARGNDPTNLLRTSNEASPNKAEAKILFHLASIRSIMRDYLSAKNLLLEAIALSPAEPAIVLKLAEVFLILDNSVEAKKYFLRAMQLQPDNLRPRKMLGEILLKHGEYEEAEKQFRHIQSLDPDDLQVKDLLLQAWVGIGVDAIDRRCDREKAVHAFEMVVSLDPKDDWSILNLAELYLLLGRPEKSEQLLKKYIGPISAETPQPNEIFLFLARYLELISHLYQGTATAQQLKEVEDLSSQLSISQKEWDFYFIEEFLRRSTWSEPNVKMNILNLTSKVTKTDPTIEKLHTKHPCTISNIEEPPVGQNLRKRY